MFHILVGLFFFKNKFCAPCLEERIKGHSHAKYTIERHVDLPKTILESSGIAFDIGQNQSYHISDSGHPPVVFVLDSNHRVKQQFSLPIVNRDFEEITFDGTYLYILDTGNNLKRNQPLYIYSTKGDSVLAKYPLAFPYPVNIEAGVYHKGQIHLFTKGRKETEHWAFENGKLSKLATVPLHGFVTGAALNPTHTELAILTYKSIHIFEVSSASMSLSRPKACIKVAEGQTEAITYLNDQDLLISNEGGQTFKILKKQR